MAENFENNLLKVDLLDIYDDIAAIDISQDQLVQLCTVFTCKVDLRIGNAVYAVEEKYKNKLANYKKSKRLKWLNVNLKAIIPNPEEKYLKWEQKHNRKKKFEWVKRKLFALDFFMNEEPLVYQSEDPCCSRSLRMPSEGQLSQHSQKNSRRTRTSEYSIIHENSNCSTAGNTSSESVQTVIASQSKCTQESSSPLINFRNISRSTSSSSSGELPSLCFEGASKPNENEAQPIPKSNQKVNIAQKIKSQQQPRRHLLPLLQESEGLSSQEDAYVTFYQDMQVTSTQEFG